MTTKTFQRFRRLTWHPCACFATCLSKRVTTGRDGNIDSSTVGTAESNLACKGQTGSNSIQSGWSPKLIPIRWHTSRIWADNRGGKKKKHLKIHFDPARTILKNGFCHVHNEATKPAAVLWALPKRRTCGRICGVASCSGSECIWPSLKRETSALKKNQCNSNKAASETSCRVAAKR